MTLNDVEGHYCCLKPFPCIRKFRLYYHYLHMNRKAHLTCWPNFHWGFFENEGLLKVTRSHVHCKCVSVSDTVQDGVVFTTDH